MISLRDALNLFTAKDSTGNFLPVKIEVVTCNLREGTGGRRVVYDNAVLAGAPFGKKNSEKPANHYVNGTRNFMVPGKSRPITIHNLLLVRINDERVII